MGDREARALALGLAWQEAEAALPEGTALYLVRDPAGVITAAAIRSNPEPPHYGSWYGQGDTPAAALRAIAADLRDEPDAA